VTSNDKRFNRSSLDAINFLHPEIMIRSVANRGSLGADKESDLNPTIAR